MKRTTTLYKAGAAIELVRFLALMAASGPLVAGNAAAPLALGVVGGPNALVAVALLFVGFNPARYDPYRPLIVVAKLVTLVSFGWLAPQLAAFDEPVFGSVTSALVFVLAGLWDALVLVLVVLARPGPARIQADGSGGIQPEVVEMD